MKKILFFAFLMIASITAEAQRSPDNIFRKYKNDSKVMYLDLGGNFAQFIGEEQDIKSEIEAVKIMIFSKGENMDSDDLKELKSSLGINPYELLIQAKTDDGKANLYVKDDGDYFTELFGIVQSDEYNIYARVHGKIYYEDITKLSMDAGGLGNFGEMFKK